jgi:hypothetical protein
VLVVFPLRGCFCLQIILGVQMQQSKLVPIPPALAPSGGGASISGAILPPTIRILLQGGSLPFRITDPVGFLLKNFGIDISAPVITSSRPTSRPFVSATGPPFFFLSSSAKFSNPIFAFRQ